MEKQVLKAVDDISLITSIINKTRQSFSGFSKIFIIWGCLYLFMTAIQVIQGMNVDSTIEFYLQHPYLTYLIPIALFGAGGGVMYKVTKAQPLLGLERQLMVLWVMVIFLQLMKVSVDIPFNPAQTSQVYSTNNLAILVYGLGMALIMTGILTELKNFKVMGGLYLLVGFIYSYGTSIPLDFILTFSQRLDVLGYIIMPFTLLYTGVYLKKHHEGSTYGTELNS